ncbi:MAG: 1-deoxy-D-xylulose-5-phosphate reductoisomerase [Candidatus Omnitrophota bacterium]
MRRIALLGSTGSIGTNTLDVIARHPDRFELIGIAAGKNIERLKTQIHQFSPELIAVQCESDARELRAQFPDKRIVSGSDGLMELVSDSRVNTMVSAIDGTTALDATLESIRRNHRICLANKETLVAAGELINTALDHSQTELIPIDSEQSAIFQSLGATSKAFVHKIILTASGGPFFTKDKREFPHITIKEALAHPTWTMGTKITIDSATLMNKALEIIEAFHLFRLNAHQIDAIIHPQSIIHSMVEFIDSSIIAQLGVPDMRLPILYSLSYPQRLPFNESRLNFLELKKLEFFPVDREKFSSIRMAYDVLKEGKNAGAVLNAANEVAVDYFLKEKISFNDIFSIVEHIFYYETFYSVHSVDDINETIRVVKRKTEQYIINKMNVPENNGDNR